MHEELKDLIEFCISKKVKEIETGDVRIVFGSHPFMPTELDTKNLTIEEMQKKANEEYDKILFSSSI